MDYFAKTTRQMMKEAVKDGLGGMPFLLFQYYLTWQTSGGIKVDLSRACDDLGLAKNTICNLRAKLAEKGWIAYQNGVVFIKKSFTKNVNHSQKMNETENFDSQKMNADSQNMYDYSQKMYGTEIAKIGIYLKEREEREEEREYTLANIESENSNVDESHDHAPKNFEKKIDAKLSQPQEPFGKKKKFIPRTEILASEIVTEQTEEKTPLNPSYPILKIYEEFFPDARLTREQLRELRTLSLDETRFRDTLKFWSLNGYKQTNLADILDCYEKENYKRDKVSTLPNLPSCPRQVFGGDIVEAVEPLGDNEFSSNPERKAEQMRLLYHADFAEKQVLIQKFRLEKTLEVTI